jgi:hypothetical protein
MGAPFEMLDGDEQRDDPLDRPVSSLGKMSVRLETVLRRENIETLRHLVSHTEREILGCPQMGKATMIELLRLLYIQGLSLREPDAQNGTMPLPFPSIHERISHIEQRQAEIIQRLYALERHPLLREVGILKRG